MLKFVLRCQIDAKAALHKSQTPLKFGEARMSYHKLQFDVVAIIFPCLNLNAGLANPCK